MNFILNESEFKTPTINGALNVGIISLLQNTTILVVVAGIAYWGSVHLGDMARDEDKGLNDRLLGYVMASDASKFDVLASWMRLTEHETANRLAELAHRGEMKDYIIDIPNRTVIRTIRQPVNSSAQNLTQTVPARSPATTMIGEPTDESYGIIQAKARLYELEQLKQSGKISKQVYEKLKEEYEKKLARADEGTQVY